MSKSEGFIENTHKNAWSVVHRSHLNLMVLLR